MAGRQKKGSSASTSSAPGGQKKNSNSALGDIESTLKSILGEMRDLKQSQAYMSDTNDELIGELKKIASDHKDMKRELSIVSGAQKKMSSDLDELKARVNKLEHEKLAIGVIIRGIDENEEAMEVVRKVANALEVQLDETSDDITASWVRAKNNDSRASFIRATMSNEIRVKQMIKRAKEAKINTGAIGYIGDERPIYVDEILTQHTRSILFEARKLRDYGVKYVWASKGDVLIRKDDGANVQRVDTMQQIDRIKREYIKATTSSKKKEHNLQPERNHCTPLARRAQSYRRGPNPNKNRARDEVSNARNESRRKSYASTRRESEMASDDSTY